MIRTTDEIIALWEDCDKCPDFKPILIDLLKERETYIKGLRLLDSTCLHCEDQLTCNYAYDPYNTGGDCLAVK